MLHQFLDLTAKKEEYSKIVSWAENGRAIRIHDRSLFAEVILPKFFPGMSHIKSFQKQLGLYGFRRVRSGPGKGSYAHPDFVQSDVARCLNIQRKNTSQSSASRSATERNIEHEQVNNVTKKKVASTSSAPSDDQVFHTESSLPSMNAMASASSCGTACLLSQISDDGNLLKGEEHAWAGQPSFNCSLFPVEAASAPLTPAHVNAILNDYCSTSSSWKNGPREYTTFVGGGYSDGGDQQEGQPTLSSTQEEAISDNGFSCAALPTSVASPSVQFCAGGNNFDDDMESSIGTIEAPEDWDFFEYEESPGEDLDRRGV
jgi:hypothetical protein